jgi:uncharacterized membrane protein
MSNENLDDSATPIEVVVARAVNDGAKTLIVADFNDTKTAHEAYEALRSMEDGRHASIEGVVVVKRGADGALEVQKVNDPSARRGLVWGLVGGVAIGILFPPSLLGSVAVLGGAGVGLSKARQRHHSSQLAERLEYAVAPSHSGIVAIVANPAAVEIRAALQGANAIVESSLDDVLAKDIRALADEVGRD